MSWRCLSLAGIDKNETKDNNFYSHSKAETIIHDSEIDNVFQSIYRTILTKTRKYQAEGSGWVIDLVTKQNINISKYKPLSGSTYIKLTKKLNHSRKGLINIQNKDGNE